MPNSLFAFMKHTIQSSENNFIALSQLLKAVDLNERLELNEKELLIKEIEVCLLAHEDRFAPPPFCDQSYSQAL